MKSIELEQNTVDWDNFRLNHIGSSDSPIILNQSKYLTREELFNIKLGLAVSKPSTFVADLGHRFEPRARAYLNLLLDLNLGPAVAEHSDYPFISASFDGLDQESGSICELKYVGEKKLNDAKAGNFDPSHYIQLQHLMFVSGFESCIYCCYTLSEYKDIDEIYHVRIPINPTYITNILYPRIEEFYLELKRRRDEISGKVSEV